VRTLSSSQTAAREKSASWWAGRGGRRRSVVDVVDAIDEAGAAGDGALRVGVAPFMR
jgi:hypothetical protein